MTILQLFEKYEAARWTIDSSKLFYTAHWKIQRKEQNLLRSELTTCLGVYRPRDEERERENLALFSSIAFCLRLFV